MLERCMFRKWVFVQLTTSSAYSYDKLTVLFGHREKKGRVHHESTSEASD
jgi:hypothetical protein